MGNHSEEPKERILDLLKNRNKATFSELKDLTGLHPQKILNSIRQLSREQKIVILYCATNR